MNKKILYGLSTGLLLSAGHVVAADTELLEKPGK